MSNTITLFICNCCQKPAHAVMQDTNHPKATVRKPPTIQVECLTLGCNNHYWTRAFREDDPDNSQALDLYTPVTMTQEQAERFVKAMEA